MDPGRRVVSFAVMVEYKQNTETVLNITGDVTDYLNKKIATVTAETAQVSIQLEWKDARRNTSSSSS